MAEESVTVADSDYDQSFDSKSDTPEIVTPAAKSPKTGDPQCDTCTRNLASVAPRWCNECTQVLCPDCALDEHCNHTLLKYGQKSNDHMEEMRELLQKMHTQVSDIKAKLAAVAERKTLAKQLFADMKRKMKVEYQKCVDSVNGVVTMVDGLCMLQTTPLTHQVYVKTQDHQEMLHHLLQQAKEQCKSTDVDTELAVVELQALGEQVMQDKLLLPDNIVSHGDN